MKAKKKRRSNRVASDDWLERIEALVGEAYEVGHDHGGNAMRMALRQPPRSIGKGWRPIAKKLQRLFKKHAL